MTALTLRLPDEKHNRLKALAQKRGVSVNRLMDEMATILLADFDAESRFHLRAERGRGREDRGLELLQKALGGTKGALTLPLRKGGELSPRSPVAPWADIAAELDADREDR
jgi:HicB family